jgi:hypothetical protein
MIRLLKRDESIAVTVQKPVAHSLFSPYNGNIIESVAVLVAPKVGTADTAELDKMLRGISKVFEPNTLSPGYTMKYVRKYYIGSFYADETVGRIVANESRNATMTITDHLVADRVADSSTHWDGNSITVYARPISVPTEIDVLRRITLYLFPTRASAERAAATEKLPFIPAFVSLPIRVGGHRSTVPTPLAMGLEVR